MKVNIATPSPTINSNPLPVAIIERLSDKYSYIPNIMRTLSSLPEVRKGLNRGTGHESTPHENAVQYAKDSGMTLYVGYRIEPDRAEGGLKLLLHSFCVNEKRQEVIEPTRNVQWSPAVRYIGTKVSLDDTPGLKYLNDFNRIKEL